MVTVGAVKLVMVAVVWLGIGLIPPKWRVGACLVAGVCPNPENSHGGAGESRGWLNSREGGPRPGQERDTRKGDAHLVRHGRWAKGAGHSRPYHFYGGILMDGHPL